jgi:hypothetical protein
MKRTSNTGPTVEERRFSAAPSAKLNAGFSPRDTTIPSTTPA